MFLNGDKEERAPYKMGIVHEGVLQLFTLTSSIYDFSLPPLQVLKDYGKN